MSDSTDKNIAEAERVAERHLIARLIEVIKDLQESIDALAASIEISKEDNHG